MSKLDAKIVWLQRKGWVVWTVNNKYVMMVRALNNERTIKIYIMRRGLKIRTTP